MKKILFFLLLPSLLGAQVKFDNIWIFDNGFGWGFNPPTPYEGTMMKFHQEPPLITSFNIGIPMDHTSTTISDSLGRLLFYANGCLIANKYHEIMANGDKINEGGYEYDHNCLGVASLGSASSYGAGQGVIILPWPDRPDQYALLHLHAPDSHNIQAPFIYKNLRLTTIDMKEDSGLGAVTQKNQIVWQDSFCDMLTAVRHANGRDWWVVLPRLNSGEYFVFLFSPEGISAPMLQKVGKPITNNKWVTQAQFSPNGKIYATIGPSGGLQVFNFNRCSGTIKLLLRTDDLAFNNTFGESYACGISFSSSSRFLYAVAGMHLYQFDMRAKDLLASKTHIAEYDGFGIGNNDTSLPTNFYHMQLAPNGKIYMTTPNGTRFLHIIHQPNSTGLACQFEQRGVEMPTGHSFGIPKFPHYRLYDLAGSPCDTLDINGPQPPEDTLPTPPLCAGAFRIWPNPAISTTQVQVPACAGGSVRVFDVAGRWLQDLTVPEGGGIMPLDVSAYPSGVYFLHWRGENGTCEVKRLVVLR